MDDQELAQVAYAAYGEATGGKNYQGEPMPAWADLGDTIQGAWRAAAQAASATRKPAEFAGVVDIQWPAPSSPNAVLPGWGITISDLDGPILTVTGLDVHASATGEIWAELTMHVDADGQPLLRLSEAAGDATATFPFLVSSMRVGESR